MVCDRASLLRHPAFVMVLWAAALLMTACLAVGVWLNALHGVPQMADFTLFYAAALSHLRGQGLYQHFIYSPLIGNIVFLGNPAHPDGMRLMENLNPPVVTFLFMPLALLSHRTAYYVWNALQFVLAYGVLLRVLPQVCAPAPWHRPALLLALAVFFPVLANMLLGQVGLFLLVLLAAAWLRLQKGDLRLAGVFFGLALLLKLFTGLILVWFLLRRRWLLLAWAAGVFALGMLAALLTFGVHDHLNWLQVIARYEATGLSWNASLHGLLVRYFQAGGIATFNSAPWLTLAVQAAAWIFAASSLIWLNRQRLPQLDTLGLALTLPLMLFLAPLGWIYYFPILLLAVLIIWPLTAQVPQPTRLRQGFVGALMLAGIPQLLAGGEGYHPQWAKAYFFGGTPRIEKGQVVVDYEGLMRWFVLPEVYTIALLLLCLLILRLAYNLRSAQTGA